MLCLPADWFALRLLWFRTAAQRAAKQGYFIKLLSIVKVRFNKANNGVFCRLSDNLRLLMEWLWKSFKDLVFPPECLGCGMDGMFLCEKCLGEMEKLSKIVLTRDNLPKEDHLDFLLAACDYEKSRLMRNFIHGLKYEFIRELAEPLGEALWNVMRNVYNSGRSEINILGSLNFDISGTKDFSVCAVPLSKSRLKWRGFNQSELLASSFAKRAGLCQTGFLTRKSFHKAQMELSREERQKNVEGVFEIKPELPLMPRKVLLIDDVATTCSTLNECAKVLKEAGAEVVGALVLARVN